MHIDSDSLCGNGGVVMCVVEVLLVAVGSVPVARDAVREGSVSGDDVTAREVQIVAIKLLFMRCSRGKILLTVSMLSNREWRDRRRRRRPKARSS